MFYKMVGPDARAPHPRKGSTPIMQTTSKIVSYPDARSHVVRAQNSPPSPQLSTDFNSFTLSNLNLLDILTMCRRDIVLKEVVRDFFHFSTSGHEFDIEVDREFLTKFPVHDHRDLYKDLGENNQHLSLSGITEAEASELLVYFGKTKRLRLNKLQILTHDGPVNTFPCNHVQELHLIDCCIDRGFLAKWLSQMNKSLEAVHLDRLVFGFPVPGELSFLLSLPLPGLRELTITDMKVAAFDFVLPKRSKLETLILRGLDAQTISIRAGQMNIIKHLEVDANCDMFLAGEFPLLQHFSVRCGQGRVKRDHLSGLRCNDSLQVLHYNAPCTEIKQLLRFKNLRQLKIHCNWFDEEPWREQFKSLQHLESVEMICNPPTPGYSFDGSLNDDLVRYIMAYLSCADCLNVGRVFPHFLTLIDPKLTLTVDNQFLQQYPPDEEGECEFYRCLGQGVRILKVASIGERDFLNVIPRFRNLAELQLEGMQDLKDLDGVVSVPLVKKLSIRCCSDVPVEYWTQLFRRLNEHLRSLTAEAPKYPLQELRNLREYSSDAFESAEEMMAFLANNTHLRKVHLCSNRSRDPFVALDGGDFKVYWEDVYFVVIRFEQILPMLDSLSEDTLKSLKVTSYSNKGELLELLKRFKNLENLDLDTAVDWTEENLSGLTALENLVALKINGKITEAGAMGIIRRLPRLRNLEFGSQVEPFSTVFRCNLIEYLNGAGRHLCINKNDLCSLWWRSNAQY